MNLGLLDTLSVQQLQEANNPAASSASNNNDKQQPKFREYVDNDKPKAKVADLPTEYKIGNKYDIKEVVKDVVNSVLNSEINNKNALNFDKKFIEEMIPHHQMAVMMAEMLKSGTQREEMRKLADDIIKAQTEEIEMMREWYSDWGYSTLNE